MDSITLYNSPNVANKIKMHAKQKNISLKTILTECNLGTNTFSHMLHGRAIAFDSLAKIADCLDCSVDYLLGRTDVPEINKHRITSFVNEEVAAFGGKVAHAEQPPVIPEITPPHK